MRWALAPVLPALPDTLVGLKDGLGLLELLGRRKKRPFRLRGHLLLELRKDRVEELPLLRRLRGVLGPKPLSFPLPPRLVRPPGLVVPLSLVVPPVRLVGPPVPIHGVCPFRSAAAAVTR